MWMQFLKKVLLLWVLNVGECQQQVDKSRVELAQWGSQVGAARWAGEPETSLGYFAICTAAKNEQNGIREWVQYHLWRGVDKIYLYDNGSNPPLNTFIMDFITSGQVDYMYFRHANDFEFDTGLYQKFNYKPAVRNRFQAWAYNSCFQQFGRRHQFIGLFDIDEFLVIPNNHTQKLNEYLTQFEQYGGVKVFRHFFGSMGFTKKPAGGVLESYTACTPNIETYAKQKHAKQITNMKFFSGLCAVHYCLTSKPTVNTVFVENTSQNKKANVYKATFEGLVINHYFLKSEEELEMKFKRKVQNASVVTEEFMERKQQQLTKVLDEKVSGTQCLEGIELYKMCCSNSTTSSSSSSSA